jgi:MerR family transcriptional regulator, light-induced transcriptional regulator
MDSPEKKSGEYIKANIEMLLGDMMDEHSRVCKGQKKDLDNKDAPMYLSGMRHHMSYLSESLLFSSPELFLSAIGWGKIYLPSINIPEDRIVTVLASIRKVLERKMPDGIKGPALDYLDEGLNKFSSLSESIDSFLDEGGSLYDESRKYLELLLDNKRMEAGKLVMDLAKKGADIQDIYLEVFQNTQYELGRLWQTGIISVAQEHYCTASTQLVMSQLYPYIFKAERTENVFIGACVSGELHEIGIRMLSDMLELKGWDTYYLGANMPADSIVKTVIERKAKIVGLSATMTFHISKIEEQIKAIREDKRCSDVKILVGGYVFKLSSGLWKKVGADGYGKDLEDSLVRVEDILV